MASENEEAGELSLNLLPEGCIANVLSFTSPLAACRLSIVSPLFRSAAETDALCERFLPRDHQSILSESDSPLLVSSKKQLNLSSPNLIVLCWFLPRNNSISASVAILSSLRMVKRYQFSSQSQIWQHIKWPKFLKQIE